MGNNIYLKEYPHRFYAWPLKKQKWFIAGVYITLATLFLSIIALVVIKEVFWPLILFPFILVSLASFGDAPSGKISGSLIYYSPLFISTKPRKNKTIIHAGTPFDYFFVFRKKDRGIKAKKIVLIYFLDGLIKFIDNLSENSNESLTIEGTSYFFSEKTARKLGFEVAKAGFDQVFILTFNFLPLMFSYSFTQGKWSFPKLGNMKQVSISSGDLILQRAKIMRLREVLAPNLAQS